MAKYKAPDYTRLCRALEADRQALQYYREERREAIRQYAGAHWSERGSDAEMPCNMLDLFIRAMVRNLVAKNPRWLLSTFDKDHKPAVKAAEEWANHETRKQHLERVFQRLALDALFLIGIAKVALASPADSSLAGWNLRAGDPFIEAIDFDDFVFDTHAKTLDEAAYLGHRFRVPLDSVKRSDVYEKKARMKLEAQDAQRYNPEGDERTTQLGRDDTGSYDEWEEMVDCWEIYLRRRRRVVTFVAPDGGIPAGDEVSILRDVEWLGPDEGPYHFLSYGIVPGNPMPKAPVMDLVYPNMVLNNLLRKLIGQAGRQKTISVTQGGADADGNRVVNSNDGDMIRLDNPDSLREMSWGGPHPVNFQFFESLRGLFDQLAGNLSMMLGLAPQSKTASQDRMLNENSSRSLVDMQETTIAFVSRVGRAWLWYGWNDPFKTMRSIYRTKAYPEKAFDSELFPNSQENREARPKRLVRSARFDDLDVRVDPYSMQFTTPQARSQQLKSIVMEIIGPMMGLLQQQNIAFDIGTFLEKIGRYEDLPDLAEIVTIQEPPPEMLQGGGGGAEGTGMPAATSREYIRRSVGGEGGRDGESDAASMMMAAAQANGDQQ